jgi:hypothetical protein
MAQIRDGILVADLAGESAGENLGPQQPRGIPRAAHAPGRPAQAGS